MRLSLLIIFRFLRNTSIALVKVVAIKQAEKSKHDLPVSYTTKYVHDCLWKCYRLVDPGIRHFFPFSRDA